MTETPDHSAESPDPAHAQPAGQPPPTTADTTEKWRWNVGVGGLLLTIATAIGSAIVFARLQTRYPSYSGPPFWASTLIFFLVAALFVIALTSFAALLYQGRRCPLPTATETQAFKIGPLTWVLCIAGLLTAPGWTFLKILGPWSLSPYMLARLWYPIPAVCLTAVLFPLGMMCTAQLLARARRRPRPDVPLRAGRRATEASLRFLAALGVTSCPLLLIFLVAAIETGHLPTQQWFAFFIPLWVFTAVAFPIGLASLAILLQQTKDRPAGKIERYPAGSKGMWLGVLCFAGLASGPLSMTIGKVGSWLIGPSEPIGGTLLLCAMLLPPLLPLIGLYVMAGAERRAGRWLLAYLPARLALEGSLILWIAFALLMLTAGLTG